MIVFDNVGKGFLNRKGEVSWIVRHFTAVLEPGRSLGILVPPSQGKTTLINLAVGNERLSEGRIVRRGRISWPWGSNSAISGRLSGRQNLRFLCDIYGRNFKEAFNFVDEFSGLGRSLDKSMKDYSSEMKGRFGISALFSMGFEFILVDNSMDGGDTNFRRKCTKYIEDNRDRLTFFIATERPNLLIKHCQKGGVLNEGKLVLYDRIDDAVEQFNKFNLVDS